MPKPKLIEFTNTNGVKLPGLLYEPPKKTGTVLINLHGNGSSSVFYSVKRSNIFGEYLNRIGISFFTFNNMGAHYIKKLEKLTNKEWEKVRLGTAYEIIKDCIFDIDGAVEFLRKQGFKKFYLMGHSTGANKIAVFNYYRPKNPFSKYILTGGGDDTGIFYISMGNKKFHLALKKCKEAIRKNKGDKLIPKYLTDYIISYKSFYDTINPDGDYNTFPFNEVLNNLKLSKKRLFREFKSIKIPTLVIYGSEDEYCHGNVKKCVKILQNEVSDRKQFTFQIIEDADHSFPGKEEELAHLVCNWLKNSSS